MNHSFEKVNDELGVDANEDQDSEHPCSPPQEVHSKYEKSLIHNPVAYDKALEEETIINTVFPSENLSKVQRVSLNERKNMFLQRELVLIVKGKNQQYHEKSPRPS